MNANFCPLELLWFPFFATTMASAGQKADSKAVVFAKLFGGSNTAMHDLGFIPSSDDEDKADLSVVIVNNKGEQVLDIHGSGEVLDIHGSGEERAQEETETRACTRKHAFSLNYVNKLTTKIEPAKIHIAKISRRMETNVTQTHAKKLKRWQDRLQHFEKVRTFLQS